MASAIVTEMQRADRSVRWVSDRSGVDRAVLASKLEEREDFTMVDLANIAAALGVPVAALTPSAGSSLR
ncbi:XRE family transcriptional regulator [Microbacterium sp. EST19A]|uniref:XRE family transcriptional regulator n=1 Tax=Microbacterium sp. EST19A TaxID=2862681 RepID=UPI001CBCD9A4|nr:XRE family transcriptional regulator [Microbacterium sp. EST19A]